MKPRLHDPLRDTLRDILIPAGEIALGHFGGVRAVNKADGTQVTVADTAVESHLVEQLQRAFPNDGIVSEEGSRVDGDAVWYCDPIDGTSAYVEGLAHWGPTVVRVRDGVLEAGALYLPRLNEFWYARRGGGAWRNGVRLAPGDPGHPGRHHSVFVPSRFHRALSPMPWPGKIRALGSSAAHLALVGGGAGLVTIIPKWHLWDVGFGVILMEEAGRRVCDVQGNPVDVIACQPGLPIMAGASTALDVLVDSGWTTSALR